MVCVSAYVLCHVFNLLPLLVLESCCLESITVLGITIDNTLSLNKYTSSIRQSMYFHMTALRHVCPALTEDIAAAHTSSSRPLHRTNSNSQSSHCLRTVHYR